ncbi:DUF4326 domain-containing protein [Rhizobium lusitanum]|uniref:DUF4326 domain-containing protein n=1 Tax=Rhizobium lusitanum TaxID=293958 RepID=A0A6L9U6N0_9HYPH|nr:DUF4326 domain-containing protein [Rhizobium lusitanum]NEI71059.1 DUF4326 domain-containing protein [Rhizobium lusitanum]
MTPAPVRLRLSRLAGFDLQALARATNGLAAVNVARPSEWGNPFVVGGPVDKKQAKRWGWWPLGFPDYVAPDNEAAVRRFAAVLAGDQAIHRHVQAKLAGRNLACWCSATEACHADVLLKLANPSCEEVKQ